VATYRDLAAVAEFRSLFAGRTAVSAAGTMQMLAMAVLVYSGTGSPLLAALAFLAGSLPQVVGAMTLLAVADRMPPRRLLAGWQLLRSLAVGLLAFGILPVWAALVLLMVAGAGDGVAGAAGYALLADVLPGRYVLGRSVLNAADGMTQVAGYGAGGIVITALGATTALWVAAALTAGAAAVYRCGLGDRPARSRARASVRGTWLSNLALLRRPRIRVLLLAQWLPNGLIVGAEALYVPYAGTAAAVLFTCSAAGMLLGDTVVGRWSTHRQRRRLSLPLYGLLAAPYLAFLTHPGTIAAAALVAAASFGYAACLGLQEQLLEATPPALHGQALGLAGSGMMSMQAVAAAATGALASTLPAGTVMAITGAASLAVTAALLARPRCDAARTGVRRRGRRGPACAARRPSAPGPGRSARRWSAAPPRGR